MQTALRPEFLAELDAWDENLARGIAPNVGIISGLRDHWRVLRFLCGQYEKTKASTSVLSSRADEPRRIRHAVYSASSSPDSAWERCSFAVSSSRVACRARW